MGITRKAPRPALQPKHHGNHPSIAGTSSNRDAGSDILANVRSDNGPDMDPVLS